MRPSHPVHRGAWRPRFFPRFLFASAVASALALSACQPPPREGWSGYAEGDYVYVAAPVAGRLAELPAPRGSAVQAGALLFSLQAEGELAARDEAAARVAGAQAQAQNTGKGRRVDEVAVTRAQLQQAKTQAALASAEWARQKQLVAQGFISASRLDDARAASQAADAKVAELEAALRVAQLPAREDERTAAQASARAAQQALAGLTWRTAQLQQRAMQAGQVADTLFRVGEWVGAGQPVVALLPSGGTKARFFVPESQLASLSVGRALVLSCDGCERPIAARIERIATQAEYTPPVIYSNTQRARLVFMVEARPEGEGAERLKPGQPLDVQLASAAAPSSK